MKPVRRSGMIWTRSALGRSGGPPYSFMINWFSLSGILDAPPGRRMGIQDLIPRFSASFGI